MPKLFSDFRTEIRRNVWSAGEAPNKRAAHDKFFVDGLIDLQDWVECLQSENTHLTPHCATLFNCGLTVFTQPPGTIISVSVIDKINLETGLEDATAPDDYCTEIFYRQVNPCEIHKYLEKTRHFNCILSAAAFFGFPGACSGLKRLFPPPTDEGLESLPALKLGYHYPQASTDDPKGRAASGVFAIENGRITIAPWIQSTETVVTRSEGVKRQWTDSDLIDDDPKISAAVEEFVRWQYEAKENNDDKAASAALERYEVLRAGLMRDCKKRNEVKGCTPSKARGLAGSSISATFYNDERRHTASCEAGLTGDPKTVVIPAGTVGSVISKEDANARALDLARTQAEGLLDCEEEAQLFWNEEQSAIASCSDGLPEGSPIPDGANHTAVVPANTFSSTVSVAAANAAALAAAESQASAQLSCTFWNSAQEYTASCPADETGDDVVKTTPAHTYSSTISQAAANSQALNAAKVAAEAELDCDGGSGGANTFYNTEQVAMKSGFCNNKTPPCAVGVTIRVSAGAFSSINSQAEANNNAKAFAQLRANQRWSQLCAGNQCGQTVEESYP